MYKNGIFRGWGEKNTSVLGDCWPEKIILVNNKKVSELKCNNYGSIPPPVLTADICVILQSCATISLAKMERNINSSLRVMNRLYTYINNYSA